MEKIIIRILGMVVILTPLVGMLIYYLSK